MCVYLCMYMYRYMSIRVIYTYIYIYKETINLPNDDIAEKTLRKVEYIYMYKESI